MPRWLRLFTFDKLKTWYRRAEDDGESDEAIENLLWFWKTVATWIAKVTLSLPVP